MKTPFRFVVSVALLAIALRAQPAQSEDTHKALQGQKERAGVVADRGAKAHYTQKFDLSGMPHFTPSKKLTGWVRFHGNNYIADGALGKYWFESFEKFQPGIRFSLFLPTSAVAFAALYYGEADLVMGHKPGFYDLLAYERVMNYDPTEITVVGGSYDVAGWENSIVILVNENCPLPGISLEQLDGIFGAARQGGWVGTNFRPDRGRGPEKNIRTWGQLGLTGEWADKPITPYGFSLHYNTAQDFADKVMQGGDQWNENLHGLAHIVRPDGTRYIEADQITDALAQDKFAIAYNRYRGERPGVKRLPVSAKTSQPFVAHTIENVQSRVYPLVNEAYFYASVPPGTEMNPMVKEFMRFVLSQEGQDCVQRDGKYLPLPAAVVREQLAKLEKL
jgi:phosphate transport system substrate-binding protein